MSHMPIYIGENSAMRFFVAKLGCEEVNKISVGLSRLRAYSNIYIDVSMGI